MFGNKYYNLQNGATSKSNVSLSQNITNTFRINKSLKGELLINYITGTMDQISETAGRLNNFSVGLQRQVLKDKGNLTLNISDPFSWWRYKNYSYFIRLYEVGTFRTPTRSITLSFAYRFGKVNNKARERNTASQEEQNR